jgi:hypothetical protein
VGGDMVRWFRGFWWVLDWGAWVFIRWICT